MFKAIVIDKPGDDQVASFEEITEAQLPEGDVLVDVAYSTLNYKDALAITGSAPIVRSYPLTPGIDFSGVVAHLAAQFKAPVERIEADAGKFLTEMTNRRMVEIA